MEKLITFLSICFTFIVFNLDAQTYYVAAKNGKDSQSGTVEAPFKTLEQAIKVANNQTGTGSITIKILPGIYTLSDKLNINPIKLLSDTTRYIIEAQYMPDESEWSQEKMPVIQSYSGNNSTTQFPHATGLLVAAEHVTIQGLKFLGNANPMVDYYYPISKENPKLEDLVVSQCYFIGDKESAKIQGGIWAHGQNNKVSHCIFYGCRNGVLFFNNVDNFTIEYSIIYGSYESAFWFGPKDYPFKFTNNIIVRNTNFLIAPKDIKYSSFFSNSIIIDNDEFVSYWSREDGKILKNSDPKINLMEIMKAGKVEIEENDAVKLAKRHLHLKANSIGAQLNAGIFSTSK